jgi:hypothetical protein
MNIRCDRSVTTRMATPAGSFAFAAVGVLTRLAAVFVGGIAAAQNVCALLQASWFHKASVRRLNRQGEVNESFIR